MNTYRLWNSALFLLVCLFVASSARAAPQGGQHGQSEAPVTIDHSSEAGDVYAVMLPTSKPLSEAASDALLAISDDGAQYRFRGDVVQLGQIRPGDVILSEASAKAPYGFMRRVTAVWHEADQIVFQTEQAALTDVFYEADVAISQQVTPAMVTNWTLPEGVTLQSVDGEVFRFEFTDVILFDEDGDESTTDDQVRASGLVVLDLAYDFDFAVTPIPPRLDELSFLVEAVETASLEIDSALVEFVDASFEYEIDTITLPPIPTGIPGISIIPELVLTVGVEGTVRANVSSSVTQQFEFSGGVTFDGDAWDTVSEFDNSFSYDLPNLSDSEMALRGYADATLNLLIGGIAGPSVTLRPYVLLTIRPDEDPWWEVTGGIEIEFGIVVTIFDATLVDREFMLVDEATLLARSWPNAVYLPFIRR